jgi:hypothetical protein
MGLTRVENRRQYFSSDEPSLETVTFQFVSSVKFYTQVCTQRWKSILIMGKTKGGNCIFESLKVIWE